MRVKRKTMVGFWIQSSRKTIIQHVLVLLKFIHINLKANFTERKLITKFARSHPHFGGVSENVHYVALFVFYPLEVFVLRGHVGLEGDETSVLPARRAASRTHVGPRVSDVLGL